MRTLEILRFIMYIKTHYSKYFLIYFVHSREANTNRAFRYEIKSITDSDFVEIL